VLGCPASCGPDAFGALPELGIAVAVGAAAAGLGGGIGAGVGPETPAAVPATPEEPTPKVDGGVGAGLGEALEPTEDAKAGEVPGLPEGAVAGEASVPVNAVVGDVPGAARDVVAGDAYELAYAAVEGEDAVDGADAVGGEIPGSREVPVEGKGIASSEGSGLFAEVVSPPGADAPVGDDEAIEEVGAPVAKVEFSAPAGAKVSPDGRTVAVPASSGVDVRVAGTVAATVVEAVEAASEPGVTDVSVAGPISPAAAVGPLPAMPAVFGAA
jgi:hypothetical protein